MNLEDATILINNLDATGLKKKLRPKHSLIQINRKGEIVAVFKFKENPTEEQQIEALNENPGTVQIPAMEETYQSESELERAIRSSMWLFDNMSK